MSTNESDNKSNTRRCDLLIRKLAESTPNCPSVDVWCDENVAYLLNATPGVSSVAKWSPIHCYVFFDPRYDVRKVIDHIVENAMVLCGVVSSEIEYPFPEQQEEK